MPDPPKSEQLGVLPRGTHKLGRDVVVSSQQNRLLDAITTLSASQGYASVTIAAIVGEARVAKPTFYEHFDDKEACFIAAIDRAATDGIAAVLGAMSVEAHPEQRGREALMAYLEFLAADDGRARLVLIEALSAGPIASAHVMEKRRLLAGLYIQEREISRERWPEFPPISETRALAAVGAMNEPLAAALAAGKQADFRALFDELWAAMAALLYT
ncbi:MAG: TetR/AcrR family transcriptional regulator [Thermoleophilaceae bacterium]|nr:TetR/AcrR family transcriptional regulator [Thermoleophilaceae bacterium]